ncbi:MgtC/SapB family protein [Mangrovitalea sediminis]|uniref:MgtC/SapB family protein n=1 Tax=Mangrovitalea sediminis TaxID=1982043 RepID=UPI000BE51000|nr:DUF4010 domain-containing protein [Mangrovitalea sediminis]
MLHFPAVPPLLSEFALTLALSFLVGLEYHTYRRANNRDLGLGTTRTFSLVGVVGLALFSLDPSHLLYALGLAIVGLLTALYYWQRARQEQYTLLAPLLLVSTYLIGPATIALPIWFVVAMVVLILVLLGEKMSIRRFSDTFHSAEMVTLAKFLLLAGVILPLLPSRPVAPMVQVTYYQVWIALLVVSGISYLSYLAQTYLFPQRGYQLTGLLGGLYSSTAASVVLARRAHEVPKGMGVVDVNQGLVLATAMMYLRLLVIVAMLGHWDAARALALPFGVFVLLSLLVVAALPRLLPGRNGEGVVAAHAPITHPLEMSTAVLFALLFVFFAALSQFVIAHYGSAGLHVLSVLVGLTDIDPFILSLLAGKFQVATNEVVAAIILASGSNNLLKALYILSLGRRRDLWPSIVWLSLLFVGSLLV